MGFRPPLDFNSLDDATDYAEALLKVKWAKNSRGDILDMEHLTIEKIEVYVDDYARSVVLFDVNVMA